MLKITLQIPCLVFIFIFFTKVNAQYVFEKHTIPQEISLHHLTKIADVGNLELEIPFVIKNFETLKPKSLLTESDDLGFTENNFWAKFQLQNSTNLYLQYYLETARPITDLVELYTVDKKTNKIYKAISGDNMPSYKRSFHDRKSVFKINLLPNANLEFYLHLKSDGEVIKIPVILRTPEKFIEIAANEQLLFGIFYGILIIACIIYMFFFFALKDIIFLYYSLYVLFIGLLQFSLDGYFYQLIVPNGGWFSAHSILIFALIAVFLLGKYAEVFLKIKTYNPTIYNLFKIVYFLAMFLMICLIFIPLALPFCYPLANVLGLFILILIISSVIYLKIKNVKVDNFFTFGILFLILGFGVFILNNFGKVPNSFLTQNSSKFGTGLEIIFLSLSMANLIRNLKNEKNELNRLVLVRLEEMNDLKSYFLSNISHELRTPLNAILNLIDSISKEAVDENIKKNCQIIKYSSNSLLSSVNDILDFSKIQKEELTLELINFDLINIIEQIKNNAEIRAKDQDLSFFYSFDHKLSNLFLGDSNRLTQIINNVLNNALKFTSQGFVRFEVETSLVNENNANLTFKISDSGVGIPQDKMNSIFDSFSQNNINNKRKFGGLGLGLYIVKTLVDFQNGKIDMKSEVNIGTTCTISINYPIVKLQQKKIEVVEKNMYDLKGKNILCVEDNAINQMVIKMITKKWLNTTVFYANNGQECLDAFKTNHFDLILMDLQMPVMDGYEATIAIRNGEVGLENANIPIVAVTADVMETTKLRVKEIGMNNYLSKPIKSELLFEAVAALVN